MATKKKVNPNKKPTSITAAERSEIIEEMTNEANMQSLCCFLSALADLYTSDIEKVINIWYDINDCSITLTNFGEIRKSLREIKARTKRELKFHDVIPEHPRTEGELAKMKRMMVENAYAGAIHIFWHVTTTKGYLTEKETNLVFTKTIDRYIDLNEKKLTVEDLQWILEHEFHLHIEKRKDTVKLYRLTEIDDEQELQDDDTVILEE